MKYKSPSYQEYLKATRYAKVRYRFGVYIQVLATLLLLYLIYYTLTNIEEMKTNPINYTEEKMGVICFYPNILNEELHKDGSHRNIRGIA